jgi:hypothetical protein
MNAEIYSRWVCSGCESFSYLMQVQMKRDQLLHCFCAKNLIRSLLEDPVNYK